MTPVTRSASRASRAPARFPLQIVHDRIYEPYGSWIETVVGIGLHDLAPGQLLDASTPFFTRDGDVNQEDLTNDAVGAWRAMHCWHFSLTDNPGVDHFSLPSGAGVLGRLIAEAQTPRSHCG